MTEMDFSEVFGALRNVLRPYAKRLRVAEDTDVRLSLDTTHLLDNGKPLWFGGVELEKSYVSFHLMPL